MVELLFHCETEIPQLEDSMGAFFLDKDIIWFDISVNHLLSSYEL